MLWLIHENYFKENVKIRFLLKYLKKHVWLVLCSLLIGTIFSVILLFLSNNDYWLFAVYTFILSAIYYFGKEIQKVKLSIVGNNTDAYEHDIISMRKILKRYNIMRMDQLDILIDQASEEAVNLKGSDRFFKLLSVGTGILVPILMLIIKWVLENDALGIYVVLQILTLTIMILGLTIIFKVVFEQLLDMEYKKMMDLKRKLEDIKIIGFEDSNNIL